MQVECSFSSTFTSACQKVLTLLLGIDMSDLPFELWLHITSFISDSEVWELRAVNRILLEVALDRRFRTVAFYLPFSKPTKSDQWEIRKLRRLTYVVQPDRALVAKLTAEIGTP